MRIYCFGINFILATVFIFAGMVHLHLHVLEITSGTGPGSYQIRKGRAREEGEERRVLVEVVVEGGS